MFSCFCLIVICVHCTQGSYCCSIYNTFSSRALWCSNRLLSAFNTSTSLDTPLWAAACRFTTVIRSDRSCRDTKHSRCSRSSWKKQSKHQNKNHSLNFTLIISSIEQHIAHVCVSISLFHCVCTFRSADNAYKSSGGYPNANDIIIFKPNQYFNWGDNDVLFHTAQRNWEASLNHHHRSSNHTNISTNRINNNNTKRINMCNQICCLN